MDLSLSAVDWTILAVYMMVMLGIGAVVSTRIKAFKDYFLAGGALTTPLLVCTLVSTYYELDVTFAASELGYWYGLVSWFWISRPYYFAIIIAALVIAPRLRRMGPMMTLADLLERAYDKPTRVVGALACFVYSLPITALAGMTLMFGVLGWPTWMGLTVSLGVCAAYTMMGGLWADAISDTMQFVLMCVSLAVAIPIAVQWVGGYGFTESLPAEHMTVGGGLSTWLIVAWTASALTVFVEPAFYQRIFAAKDQKSIVRAMLIGVLLWAAYDWGVTIMGMIARAAVEQGLIGEDLGGKRSILTVCMLTLPIGLKGLFLGGILAAAMSSVDSYGLLASGNMVYDIWRPLSKRPISDATLIRATRWGVLAVMGVAALAMMAFERISDAWIFMASTLASVVFVPVMGAIFGRPARRAGLWGAVGGLIGMIGCYVLVYTLGEWNEDAESMVATFDSLGGFELWREYAVLVALPMSAAAFGVGHVLGRGDRGPGLREAAA